MVTFLHVKLLTNIEKVTNPAAPNKHLIETNKSCHLFRTVKLNIQTHCTNTCLLPALKIVVVALKDELINSLLT